MTALYLLIDTIFSIIQWGLIIYVIMSWLFYFQVINSHNQFVNSVYGFLQAAIEPLLRPIRRFVPIIGGLDISLVILIIIVMFLRNLIMYDILRPMMIG